MSMNLINNLLDLGFELELQSAAAARRRAAIAAVDPETRHEEKVGDRAYELEIEMTVEQLKESLLQAGLTEHKEMLDEILSTLADHQIKTGRF